MKQSWYNSRTSHGGTVEHVMVEQWNRDGGTWYDGTVEHVMMETWGNHGGTVEHLIVKQWNF